MSVPQIAILVAGVVLFCWLVRGPETLAAMVTHRREVGTVFAVLVGALLVWQAWAAISSIITVVAVGLVGTWWWQRGRHLTLDQLATEVAAKFRRPLTEADVARYAEEMSGLPETEDE